MRVPGFKKFVLLSLEASSSEESLEIFSSLAESFGFSWENCCEDKQIVICKNVIIVGWNILFFTEKKHHSISGKPSKTVTGSSSLCGAGLIAEHWICYAISIFPFDMFCSLYKKVVVVVVFWFSPYYLNYKPVFLLFVFHCLSI